jgi:hypothetical protein
VTHRSMDDGVPVLAQRSAGAIRDGGTSNRVGLPSRYGTQAAARKEHARGLIVRRSPRTGTHTARAMGSRSGCFESMTHRSNRGGGAVYSSGVPTLLWGGVTRAVHRFGARVAGRARSQLRIDSVTAHCARVSMSASRAWGGRDTSVLARPFTPDRARSPGVQRSRCGR